SIRPRRGRGEKPTIRTTPRPGGSAFNSAAAGPRRETLALATRRNSEPGPSIRPRRGRGEKRKSSSCRRRSRRSFNSAAAGPRRETLRLFGVVGQGSLSFNSAAAGPRRETHALEQAKKLVAELQFGRGGAAERNHL